MSSPGGGAFDPRSLSGSESCGTSGCHTQILEEWRPSAHRYAAMDTIFQGIQGVMAKEFAHLPDYRRRLASTWSNRGAMLAAQNRWPEAEAALKKAQDDLKKVLTTKQEAVALQMGLVN